MQQQQQHHQAHQCSKKYARRIYTRNLSIQQHIIYHHRLRSKIILYLMFFWFESCPSEVNRWSNSKYNPNKLSKNNFNFFNAFEWYWCIKFYCAISLMGNKAAAAKANTANRLKSQKKKKRTSWVEKTAFSNGVLK